MAKAFKEKASVTDVELLDRIARKDRAALSAFYDRYAQRLYGMALKILQDESKAQDVMQDLFLFILENSHRFTQKRGSPAAWMMILCRNRCIDKLRRMERTQRRSEAL
ncbi:hypothetical protein MJD09_02225, partial [bacterium]|nr:hypothetical protein [bacterium]